MFHSSLRSTVSLLTAAAGCCGIIAGTAAAQPPASVAVGTEVAYKVTTLAIGGSATCHGGGTAGVNVVNGSLEQMFQGGIGGPIAVQLDGPVLVDCDGAPHDWSGNLVAPGRALPMQSGGMVTVNLSRGPTVIASTGEQPIRITG